MAIDADQLFERYASTKVTVVSGTLVPCQATRLDQGLYPSLEEASRAARERPETVVQMILHVAGGLDQPLTSEQMNEVLKPRREYASVAIRSGLRMAKDILELLPETFTQITAEMQSSNLLGSSSYFRSLRSSSLSAYKESVRVLIGRLIAAKLERARNRRTELESALEDLAELVQRRFDEQVSSSLYSRPADEIAELEGDLARAQARMLLDFDDGVYHSMAHKYEGSNISIGSIGQMAGHIGAGNSGTVRAEQTWNDSTVLEQLAVAIRSGVSDNADRVALLAAVEALKQSRDDKSLFAAAYGAFISTAADYTSLIAPFIPALGHILIG